MFVKIERKTGVTAITVDTWIKKVREDGFTPKEAMQVLKWSNFYGNIKQVVREIRVYNDVRVYRMFEDFIVSAVDGRETSNDTLTMLRDLAVECGFEEEFDKANANPKVYDKNGVNVAVYDDINDWYEDLDVTAKVVHTSDEEITDLFADTDRKAPEELVMINCEEIEFAKCVDMNKFMAIKVKYVNLSGMDVLPKNIELSDCDKVDFCGSDLTTANIIFQNCREVIFDSSTKFPEVLDLSGVDEVDLSQCDLADVKEIKFKKGAKVNLSEVENLSPNIDLSAPAELDLSGVDVSHIEDSDLLGNFIFDSYTILPKKVTFSAPKITINGRNIVECEEVIFEPSVKNVVFATDTEFPEVLDLSSVDKVDLSQCDLANVKEIKFKKGAKVNLSEVENLSPNIDLSGLFEVDISGVDVSHIEDSDLLGNFIFDSYTILPKKMIFSDPEVEIEGRNIVECEEVIFEPSVKYVVFAIDTEFPEVLDLSSVDKVDLAKCDLVDVKEIKFKKGANVNLANVLNLSQDINLSGLSEVDISGIDVSHIEDSSVLGVITYNSGTKLPKKMVFKEEAVDIFELNIANCEEVVFAPSVKKVNFSKSTIFPEVLDFSQCDDIEISVGDVEKMKRVMFRDKEQRDKILANMDLGPIDRIRLKRKSEYVGSNVKKNSKTISVPQREMGD